MIGSIDEVQESVRSEEDEEGKMCPDKIKEWTEVTKNGFVYNKYIKVDCYYRRLLNKEGFENRVQNGLWLGKSTEKLALIRFLDENVLPTQNDGWNGFQMYFDDTLDQYNGKISIHQVSKKNFTFYWSETEKLLK